jgi:fibronectin-binding autotransporter adhesin
MKQSRFRNLVEKLLSRKAQRRRPRRLHLGVELLERREVPTAYTWAQTAAGSYDWNDPNNWSPNSGFPSAAGDIANLTSPLAANETVNLNVPITVGTLNLGASVGTNTFTLAANGGSLTLADPSLTATIAKTSGGADQIATGLTLTNNLAISNSSATPLAFSGTTASTSKTVTINPGAQTGEVDFTAANALNTGNITVSSGTLGIGTMTLTKSRAISIAAGGVVNSLGTLNLNAQGSASYPDAVSGSGTLRLASTTNSATSPDIYFNPNDPASSNPNYGNRISAHVDLGSSQRYIFVRTNHNSFGTWGQLGDALMNGPISGSGGITLIGQTNRSDMEAPLVLGGANTFTGMLEIQRGSVYLNNPNALSQGNPLLLDPAAGNNARLFLYGNNAVVSNLASSGAGNTLIANGNLINPAASLPAATLTVNQTTPGTFGGQLLDYFHEYNSKTGTGTTGALNLVLTGTSTLTLTADYSSATPNTGTVTVNGGTLLVNNTPTSNTDAGLPTGGVTVNSGGTLGGTGTIALASGATVTVNTGGTLTGLLTINNAPGTPVVDSGVLHPTGNSPTGQFMTSDLTLANGTYMVDLNGQTLGNGYDQVLATGTVTLTNENLSVTASFPASAGATFDILSSPNAIVGTFNGASEGGTVTLGGQSFTITYLGGVSGHDVVLTRQPPPIVYADTAWIGLANGTTINNPNPNNPGAPAATIGMNAFASINAAIAAVPAFGEVIVNGSYSGGGSGAFHEDVLVNKLITVLVQAGPASFDSLASSVLNSVLDLSVDAFTSPITLRVGGDNASTTVLSSIVDVGNLVKTGAGTMIVSGKDTYIGATTVNSGSTLQAGSATAFSSTSSYTVNGTLSLNGFSAGVTALAGSGIVQNGGTGSATLTIGVPSGGSTFSGLLKDGGTGALNVAITGAGAFTIGGANTYTGTTTIGGGSTLMAGVLANGLVPSSLGASSNAAGNLVLQGGGTLLYTGATASTDRGFTLGSGGGTLGSTKSATTLTVNGNIANGSNALTLAGAGPLVFGGILTGGSGTLTDNGPGDVMFAGSNALNTGNIAVNAGTLTIGNLTLSLSRVITIAPGANVNSTGSLRLTADASFHPNTQVTGGGTLNLTSTTNGPTSPDIYFSFNDVDGTNTNWGTGIDATINLGSGQRYFFSKTNHSGFGVYGTSVDAIVNGPIIGSGGITLIGQDNLSDMEAPLVLAGANTFTGKLEIDRGSVYLDNPSALVQGNILTFAPAAGNNARLFLWGNNAVVSDLSSSGAGTVLVANGNRSSGNSAVDLPTVTLTVVQNHPGIFGGALVDNFEEYSSSGAGSVGGVALVKQGPATLTLTGSSTTSGGVTISGGVLSVSSLVNGGTASSLGASSSDPVNLVLDGGTLQYTGAATTTDRLFTVTGNGGAIDASGTGALVFSNTGAVVFSGAGTTTFTLTGNSTAGNLLAPVLADSAGGATSVFKSGTGSWDLTGINTYTGSTTVSMGTLDVDGSLAGSITVASGATLAGSGGTIAGAVSVSGTLTAGNAASPTGTLTVGNLAFGASAALNVLLNGAAPGTGYDQTTASGTINLTGAVLNISVGTGFSPPGGTILDVLVNTSGNPITGTFIGLPQGATITTGGEQYTISYTGTSSSATGGHDVVLTRIAPAIVYADTRYTTPGAMVNPDPLNPSVTGVVGVTVFSSVNAAVAALPASGVGTVIVNGDYDSSGNGHFNEAVSITTPVLLQFQAGPIFLTSLADSSTTSTISLSGASTTPAVPAATLNTDGTGITHPIMPPIVGAGNLTKAGPGTLVLAGNDLYSGTTTVSSGTLTAGSAAGFSLASVYLVNGTLALNGFAETVGALSGTGTVQNGSATPVTLTVNSSGSNTFNGVLKDGGTGSLSLATAGTGSFTPGNANTYTGSTTVGGGSTLMVGILADGFAPSSIGQSSNAAGNLILQGGSTLLYTGATSGTDRSLTLGSGGGMLGVSTAAVTLTVSGTIVAGANPLTFAGAGNLSFGGVVNGTTGTVTDNGPGNVTFTANNALNTGNITVNAGTLQIATQRTSANRTLIIAGGAVVASTGTLYLDVATSANGGGASVNVSGAGTLKLASTTSNNTTSPDLWFGQDHHNNSYYGSVIAANIDLGSSQRYIFSDGGHNSVSHYYSQGSDSAITGNISGSGGITYFAQDGGYNPGGDGQEVNLVLQGNNTFTGPFEIDRGSIYLTSSQAFPAGDALTFNTSNGNNAKLFLVGNSVTVSSLSSKGDGSGSQLIANGNVHNNANLPSVLANGGTAVPAATLTINQTANTRYDGSLFDSSYEYEGGGPPADPLSVVKQGGGTLTLTGLQAYAGAGGPSIPYSGSLTVSGGTLNFANAAGLPSSGMITLDGGALQYTGPSFSTGTLAYVLTVTGNGAALDASGSGPLTLGSSGSTTFSGTTATTLTLTGSNSGPNTLAAVVADGTAPTAVTKTGTGTWDLSAADTYTGPTAVNAGTLLVDGSVTGTATVAAGATLGGGGGTLGSVVSNGTLSPGNLTTATGLLTVGSLSFSATGGYTVDIDGATAGTGFDQVTASGPVTLNGATLQVNGGLGFSPVTGTTFDILVNSGAAPGTFAGLPEGATVTSSSGQLYSISYVGGSSGHDVVLTAVASPTQLAVTAPPTATAGMPFSVTITAEDAGGNKLAAFSGTVTLSSSAGADIAPTTVLVTAGTATVPVTLTTSGRQNIVASFGSLTPGSAAVTVNPAALNKYLVNVTGPSTIQAGTGFLVTVQAADQYNNPIVNYTGPASVTASLSPTSASSSFPTTVAISPFGLGFFEGTIQKSGIYTISVANGSFTGSAPPVTITHGAAARLAFATQPVTTPTGLTLPPVTVQVLDINGNPATGDNSDTVMLGVASGPGAFTADSTTSVLVHNGLATFSNLKLAVPGDYTLSALVPGLYTGPHSASFKIMPLQVTSIDPDDGFTLQFNAPFLVNSVTPVLYGPGFGASAPAPSITLTQIKDAAGHPITPVPVEGSVILNTAANSLRFLATNTASEINNGTPILPDGTYQVVVRSFGPTGLQGKLPGGGYLDGLGSGAAGSGDYMTTFTVTAAASHKDVLWAPDTADGPLQPLNAPGANQSGGGYPIYLDQATGNPGATDVQVTLTYDPTLLIVTPSSSPTFTVTVPTAGTAVLHYAGPALTGTSTPIGFITASVPNSSAAAPIYRAKDILHLSSPSINGGSVPVTTSDGLHLVAYVGDGDGNGSYSSADAVLVTRVALQTDAGFTAYPLVDPVIVADTDGSGFIPADAPLQVNEAGVGFATANLPSPPIPSGANTTPIGNNVDPMVSLPTVLQVGANGLLTVPVTLDDAHPAGSTGLIEAHLALTYDPSMFTVSAADVHSGLLLAGGNWSIVPTIDQVTGQIAIALSSSTPIASGLGGILVTIDFHQIGATPGRIAGPSIDLVASVNIHGQVIGTELEDAQGTFTLTPAPVNGFDPRIDGVVIPAAIVVSPETAAEATLPSIAEAVPVQDVHPLMIVASETTAPIQEAALSSSSEPEATDEASVRVAEAAHPLSLMPASSDAALLSGTPLLGMMWQLSVGCGVVVSSSSAINPGQRLADQFFQGLVRGTEASAVSLVSSPLPADELDHLNWDEVGSAVDWQTPVETTAFSQNHAGRVSAAAETTVRQQAEHAALDECFAQEADEDIAQRSASM